MAINNKKFKTYVTKLYNGEKKLLKKMSGGSSFDLFIEKSGKPERENVSSSQRKKVMRDSGEKCQICAKPHQKHLFSIHHMDGDRSHTDSSKNLVLLCKDCHSDVHSEVKAKLKDAKIKASRGKNKKMTVDDFFGIGNLGKSTKGPDINEMLYGKSTKKKKKKGNSFDDLIGW
jgi:hypothetical protein